MGYAIVLLSAVWSCFTPVLAQFHDVTSEYQLYVESASGNVESGVSFHDFDRDGLDDLTYGSVGMGVYTYRNTGSGFEPVYYFAGVSGAIQHPIWIDYDNDGDSDFFTTRFGDCPVLMRNLGDMIFEDVSASLTCSDSNPNNTSASWADYDNDGFVDVYIANYYPSGVGSGSWCYHNNGDGTFTETAAALGIDNGVSPTYQVLWIDYDRDGDQDLLISNDKFVGNRLYQNDGTGAFTDVSEVSGFAVAINAMSLSPGDPDRDGDFDFYISNTTEGNVLMIQDAGSFTNTAEAMGAAVNANCWGSVFIDTQGKMWEDIYVVATGPEPGVNMLLRNVNGGAFEENVSAFQGFDSEYLYSVAKGDANSDGRYDVACNPYQNNQSLLFESNEPDTTSVKFLLQGTVSNRDGIGAIVTCHVGDAVQLRAKTCGENYLSQDSQHLLFATQGQVIDSVVVQWPSGVRDVVYNPQTNQSHLIVESSLENAVQVVDVALCSGDTLYLQPEGGVQVDWSTGSQELVLPVSAAGEYSAEVTDEQGQVSDMLYVVSIHPELDYQLQLMEPSCYGVEDGVVQWFSEDWIQVWVNDAAVQGESLTGLSAGVYLVHLMNEQGCAADSLLVLNEPAMLTASAVVEPGCFDGLSAYTIEPENAQGVVDVLGLESLQGALPSGEFSYTIHDAMGCSFSSVLSVETMAPFVVENYADTLCAYETDAPVELQFTGGVYPWTSVGAELPLEALPPGDYQTQWVDAAGCLATGTISIIQLEPIVIEVEQNVGQIELEIEGGWPPYQIEWSNGAIGSTLTADPGFYMCFVTDNAGCLEQSEVELMVGVEPEDQQVISPYPMPFDDVLQWSGPQPSYWRIYNAQGQRVADERSLPWGQWDTQNWKSGVYYIHFFSKQDKQQSMMLIKR